MRGKMHGEAVADELSAIAGLSRADLVERWETAYNRPPPKGISRRLLECLTSAPMEQISRIA